MRPQRPARGARPDGEAMTRRPAVLLIALGLGLSACGGGGGGGGGTSASSFCSLIKGDAKKFAKSASAADSLSAFQTIENDAPSAIKSDMKTLVGFLKDAEAKHSPSPADLGKLETASKNVSTYVKDKCKFDLNAS
jgi:hypothetical protein